MTTDKTPHAIDAEILYHLIIFSCGLPFEISTPDVEHGSKVSVSGEVYLEDFARLVNVASGKPEQLREIIESHKGAENTAPLSYDLLLALGEFPGNQNEKGE